MLYKKQRYRGNTNWALRLPSHKSDSPFCKRYTFRVQFRVICVYQLPLLKIHLNHSETFQTHVKSVLEVQEVNKTLMHWKFGGFT